MWRINSVLKEKKNEGKRNKKNQNQDLHGRKRQLGRQSQILHDGKAKSHKTNKSAIPMKHFDPTH